MAENDIYNNKKNYEVFLKKIDSYNLETAHNNRKTKYKILNDDNVVFFHILAQHFDFKDTSYVRRLRYMRTLIAICGVCEKNLKDIQREDINQIISILNNSFISMNSKKELIKGIKYFWKIFFPEKDEKGRIDETIIPYAVRHLKVIDYTDKSRQKKKDDRFNYEELQKLIAYFDKDKRIQAYLMLAFESLARPQELLYRKIKDLEHFQDYGKIHLTDHTKEGTGILQCIDSYPYLLKWLEEHPRKKDSNAWLFCTTADNKDFRQLTPFNVNKHLRIACKHLGIKNITCYSLKRNGVTFRRLRGDSDIEIQHTARWTSTKQLQTYDKSTQEDAFRISLIKRGLIKDNEFKDLYPKSKECAFCGHKNQFHKDLCENCKRPLDQNKIKQHSRQQELEFVAMKKSIELLQENMKKIQKLIKKNVRLD